MTVPRSEASLARSTPLRWLSEALPRKIPFMNAGRSSGVRLVTRLPSRTTAASSQIPPAFSTSSRIDMYPVTFRPFRHFVEQSIHGPWQIAASTFP